MMPNADDPDLLVIEITSRRGDDFEVGMCGRYTCMRVPKAGESVSANGVHRIVLEVRHHLGWHLQHRTEKEHPQAARIEVIVA